MTREQSYNNAFEQQRIALAKRRAEYERLTQNLSEENPRFSEINRRISSLGANIAITAISGEVEALKGLQAEISALSKEREVLLQKAGIKPVEYECSACNDTGYINGKICDCIHAAAKKITIDSLGKNIPLKSCRFENFDLNYYPNEEIDGANSRKRMTQILKLCREYTLNFNPETSESMLFLGNTGLGKTHLTLSIVYELLSRGFNVIYGSAHNLFSQMESEHFDRHTNTSYNEAVDCDLLVIDDLGCEFASPYIKSVVYNLINTRGLSNKPTIINTNISMQEIADIYTPRGASRLMNYTTKKFVGNDIRQLKKIEKI